MQGTIEELQALLKIQDFDLAELRALKKRDSLPQRGKILVLRKKKKEIEEKAKKLSEMRKIHDTDLAKIRDEDEHLKEKYEQVQTKLNTVQGDYRSVEALTRELNGHTKRRLTLEGEMNEIQEKRDRVKAVQDQVDNALSILNAQEDTAVKSFQKEGGDINEEVARVRREREKLVVTVSPELYKLYQDTAGNNRGIGIGRLEGDRCSICRNDLPDGKILKARAEAPLSTCPLCKRLLVVE